MSKEKILRKLVAMGIEALGDCIYCNKPMSLTHECLYKNLK